MNDWQEKIKVNARDDGYHVQLSNPEYRTKLADAIKSGTSPLIVGEGDKKCVFEFGDTATAGFRAGT